MKKIFITFFFFSCGPVSGDFSYLCTDDVFTDVAYTHQVDCVKSKVATNLAAQLLRASGLWNQPKTGIKLYVRDEFVFDCLGNMKCFGMAYGGLFSRVEVGSSQEAILHELLHIKDYQNIVIDDHINWDLNGRYAVSNLYAYIMTKVLVIGGSTKGCKDDEMPNEMFNKLSNEMISDPQNPDDIHDGLWWMMQRKSKISFHCINVK